MESLNTGNLRIELTEAPEAVRATWLGKSVDRRPGKLLDPFLTELVALAKSRTLPLEHHFEGLELFNSSTITSIIQSVQDAREQGVRLVIVYDAAVKWQRLSFDALRVFSLPDGLCELRSI